MKSIMPGSASKNPERPQSYAARLNCVGRCDRMLDRIADGAVQAVILAAFALLVFPLAMSVVMSFDARSYLGQFPPPTLSLGWYERFFSDSYLLNGLRMSLLLASASATLATALGLAAAVAIKRLPGRTRDTLTAMFLAPLIVPGVVIGFALLVFYARVGFDNGFLRLLGGHVLITFPYAIRTILAALDGVRPSLTEAALSLGANRRRAFWTVTFPLVKTGVAAGAIFAFAFSLDDVATSLFLSDPQNYTLPVALISMMHANFDLTIAAVAVLLMGLTSIMMIVIDRLAGLDRIVGASFYRT
jgi:putative spermidine/putrescine transport system permease protein